MPIKQTNRTILFEEINSEKQNLIALLADTDGKLSVEDSVKAKIHKNLVVSSFEEFLEKFEPKVYSYFDGNKMQMAYSLEKPKNVPDGLIKTNYLNNEDSVLSMLFQLIERKQSMGVNNNDFDFEKITSVLSPKSMVEDIKLARKELENKFVEYNGTDDENPKKQDLALSLNTQFTKIRESYSSPFALLPIAIEDAKTRLESSNVQITTTKDGSDKMVLGRTKFDPEGNIILIEYKGEPEKNNQESNEDNSLKLVEYVEGDYEKNVGETKSDFAKSLIVRTYVPNALQSYSPSVEQDLANYKKYVALYKADKTSFIKVAKTLIQKVLGVKQFFEQGRINNNQMPPKLLITNISLEMCLKKKERLEKYLESVNGISSYEDCIWFGIVPEVALEKPLPQVNNGPFPVEPPKDNGNTNSGNSIENLAGLLEILQKYRIQTFFSFQANEHSGFSDLISNGIENYSKKVKNLEGKPYSEFGILCLPNFTIIPKDKSFAYIANNIEMVDNKINIDNNQEKIVIGGVYLSASYIAAGLVAGYQSPTFLNSKVNKVNSNPGVRLDLETNKLNLKLTSNLAREISGYTDNIIKGINQTNFGFTFSSDSCAYNGKTISNVFVMKARSLMKNGDYYRPIFETTVISYFTRYLKFITNNYQANEVKKFFEHPTGYMKSVIESEAENENIENLILTKDDSVTYSIDGKKCNLIFKFNGPAVNLEIIVD